MKDVLVGLIGFSQRSCSILSPVSTEMSDGPSVGEPSQSVASSELSLAVPRGQVQCVQRTLGVNRHTTRC